MYNKLHEVFEEAVQDHATTSLNGTESDARMSYGVKIVRNHLDNSIEIFNTAKGGDYYKELDEDEEDELDDDEESGMGAGIG